MKYTFQCVALALTLLCSPALKPVVTKIDVMRNPETGQNIILLGDIHHDLPSGEITFEQQEQLLTFLKKLNKKSNGSLVCSIEDATSLSPHIFNDLAKDQQKVIFNALKNNTFRPHMIVLHTDKLNRVISEQYCQHTPLCYFSLLTSLHGINTYNAEECERLVNHDSALKRATYNTKVMLKSSNPKIKVASQNLFYGLKKDLDQLIKEVKKMEKKFGVVEKQIEKKILSKNVSVETKKKLIEILAKLYKDKENLIQKYINNILHYNYRVLDIEMLHTILCNSNAKHIVLFAGKAHTQSLKDALLQSKYQLIKSYTKTEKEFALDLQGILPQVIQLLEQPAIAQLQSKL